MGLVVSATSRPFYHLELPGTHFTRVSVGSRACLNGYGKFAPNGIRSPDLPARSKSLYRLRYSGPPLASSSFEKQVPESTGGKFKMSSAVINPQTLAVRSCTWILVPQPARTVYSLQWLRGPRGVGGANVRNHCFKGFTVKKLIWERPQVLTLKKTIIYLTGLWHHTGVEYGSQSV